MVLCHGSEMCCKRFSKGPFPVTLCCTTNPKNASIANRPAVELKQWHDKSVNHQLFVTKVPFGKSTFWGSIRLKTDWNILLTALACSIKFIWMCISSSFSDLSCISFSKANQISSSTCIIWKFYPYRFDNIVSLSFKIELWDTNELSNYRLRVLSPWPRGWVQNWGG